MRAIPGTVTDPAMDRLYAEPRDRSADIVVLEQELAAEIEVIPLEPADGDPPKYIIGEYWLRGKVAALEPEEFHRADPRLVALAVSDVLLELDRLRVLTRVLAQELPAAADLPQPKLGVVRS